MRRVDVELVRQALPGPTCSTLSRSAASWSGAPRTRTVKVPVATLPEPSAAVQRTVVVPIGNVLADAGVQRTAGFASTSSVAVAAYVTLAPPRAGRVHEERNGHRQHRRRHVADEHRGARRRHRRRTRCGTSPSTGTRADAPCRRRRGTYVRPRHRRRRPRRAATGSRAPWTTVARRPSRSTCRRTSAPRRHRRRRARRSQRTQQVHRRRACRSPSSCRCR